MNSNSSTAHVSKHPLGFGVSADNIAYQHPFYGGDAVYCARAILHLDVVDELPQLRRANTHQQSKELQATKMKKGKLLPNPANYSVTFTFNGKFENKLILKIVDGLGKLVMQEETVNNDIKLPTSNLVQGIYEVIVFDGNGFLESHRLTIAH
jgi:hypothetical protein